MSGKSKRENKTVYQLRREELEWSRAKASEETYISENRLEKIETGKTTATPEDVVAMAKSYKYPELCRHYCAHECAIGEHLDIPMTERKGLAKIVLEVLTTLNQLDKEKDRLIEIAADELITDDEMADFKRIQVQLADIASTAESLKLWITDAIIKGNIDAESIKELKIE